LGLGSAVLEGIKAAEGEIVGVIDADFQHPPEMLRTMKEKAEEGADIVIASRYVEGGKVENWSISRKAVSKGALWLSHLFLPKTRGVKDTLSGYFIFKKDIVQNITLNTKGFKLLIELLVKGNYEKVVEVPYVFRTRTSGTSKMDYKEMINYIKQILRLSDYRVLKFMTVGVIGIIVNNGILWLLISTFGIQPLLADLVSIEASILSNFIMNNFWTFKDRQSGSLLHRLVKYHLSVAAGALANFSIFMILNSLGLHYIVANTIGILFGFILNYIFSEMIVWK
jgi:dolichol-phosphate mannosyltransferase